MTLLQIRLADAEQALCTVRAQRDEQVGVLTSRLAAYKAELDSLAQLAAEDANKGLMGS